MHSFLPLLLLVPSVLGRPQGLAVEELNKVAIHTAGPAITAASVSNAFDQVAADAVAVAAVTNAPVAAPTTAAKLARREDAILEKRGVNDPCGLQPVGYTYTTKPDTDSAFLSDTTYSSTANSAVTPYGYSQTFKNLQGSTSYGTFMELITINSYDPVQCAHLCDSNPDGCTSFNLYYERDPTVNPAPACLNPSSLTNVKCTLWKASTQSGAGATNTGQWRYDFHVVIAGSNGYFKDAAPPAYSGYEAPVEEGCAIDAPLAADGSNTFLGTPSLPILHPRDSALLT